MSARRRHSLTLSHQSPSDCDDGRDEFGTTTDLTVCYTPDASCRQTFISRFNSTLTHSLARPNTERDRHPKFLMDLRGAI